MSASLNTPRSLRLSGAWPQVKKTGGSGTGGTVWDPSPPRSAAGENRTSCEGVVVATGTATLSAADRRDTSSTGGTVPEASKQRQLGACEPRRDDRGVRESGVRRRLHVDQLEGETMASHVAASQQSQTDHVFSVAKPANRRDCATSVAALVDGALRATTTGVSAMATFAGVSATVVRRWLDPDRDDAPNLRHVSRLPARLRHALLWPLLDGADPAPSVAWALGEVARCMADLGGCIGDPMSGATVDRIGAELVWIGTRMRAMGGGR
jgi:hypothetical protein